MWAIYKLLLGFSFKSRILDAKVKDDIRSEVLTFEKGFMYSRKF